MRTRWGAAVTAQSQQSTNPLHWVTQWAPEPRDIDWPNVEIPHDQLFLRSILSSVLAIALTFVYVPITTAVKALGSLNSLKEFLPQVIVDNVLAMYAPLLLLL
jgi:hypothetical protein